MKKMVWTVCFMVTLFMGAHAQFDARQAINKSMQLCLGRALFPAEHAKCSAQQLDQTVDQALQRGLDKQDCQIHDMYTQSYLQKASQEQKPLVITRSAKDWRELHLLGDAYRFEKVNRFARENSNDFINNYVNGRAEQRISIHTFTAKRTPQEAMEYIRNLFDGTSFKLQMYDPGNKEDGMLSFLRSNQDGTVNYMVYRVFKGPEGKIFLGRVSRQLGSVNVPIMQGIFRALKQTPTQTLTDHFVENECQMGADCS